MVANVVARRQSVVDAQEEVNRTQAQAKAAADNLRRLQIEEDDIQILSDPVARWCQDQQRFNASQRFGRPVREEKTPDDWIDLYRDGVLRPNTWVEPGPRSSVTASLEPFSGKALDWFSWIDLFRALVHDTSKAPGEKLAILKRNLKGECLDVVYGLGGGEPAYIEALSRLKQSFCRRDVMRSAHVLALNKLDFNSTDSSSFKRYAEKVRTHLYDLSQIKEAKSAEIIERI